MKSVPHSHWLILLYLAIVVIPVFIVHDFLKKRVYANRTFGNLIIYFIAVLITAFAMHLTSM